MHRQHVSGRPVGHAAEYRLVEGGHQLALSEELPDQSLSELKNVRENVSWLDCNYEQYSVLWIKRHLTKLGGARGRYGGR